MPCNLSDPRIRVKIRNNGFEVVRSDIPGLKYKLVGENTDNATLTVMHESQTDPRPCPPRQNSSLGGGKTFGGVQPFTIGTGQQPMTFGGVLPVGVGTNQPTHARWSYRSTLPHTGWGCAYKCIYRDRGSSLSMHVRAAYPSTCAI